MKRFKLRIKPEFTYSTAEVDVQEDDGDVDYAEQARDQFLEELVDNLSTDHIEAQQVTDKEWSKPGVTWTTSEDAKIAEFEAQIELLKENVAKLKSRLILAEVGVSSAVKKLDDIGIPKAEFGFLRSLAEHLREKSVGME